MNGRWECIKKCIITGSLTLALSIASIILIANTDLDDATEGIVGKETVISAVMTENGETAAVLQDEYGRLHDSVNVAARTTDDAPEAAP